MLKAEIGRRMNMFVHTAQVVVASSVCAIDRQKFAVAFGVPRSVKSRLPNSRRVVQAIVHRRLSCQIARFERRFDQFESFE